jgi:hypothetical protein
VGGVAVGVVAWGAGCRGDLAARVTPTSRRLVAWSHCGC